MLRSDSLSTLSRDSQFVCECVCVLHVRARGSSGGHGHERANQDAECVAADDAYDAAHARRWVPDFGRRHGMGLLLSGETRAGEGLPR